MDFEHSQRARELQEQLWDLMHTHVFPAEAVYEEQLAAAGDPHAVPEVMDDLKAEARRRGLWNLFLPAVSGLSNLEYASLAEITGWSGELAPQALNCNAPDTGNMETLHLFGTPEQQQTWLEPLLEGRIRSAFCMTEPAVASSDATNIECTIRRDGDEYVIDGRKWWATNAMDPRTEILIVMGKTDPEGPRHAQQSMVLVPRDTPGIEVVRSTKVLGFLDRDGHAEIVFDGVRVPASNLLAGEGDGFRIAQARLGPGRIHHCMRAIGAAERALDLLCSRATDRVAFGKPLADQGLTHQAIAESRVAIDQARLYVQQAAWRIDRDGAQGAAQQIAAIKLVVPRMAAEVIDRAIQIHGGAGVSEDTPLAQMYAWHRAMRLFDGPDEVHLRTVARSELKRERTLR
ncbi:acyl-CoA dehydrogenase [Nitriliruptoraceae bacterium ZYF776]|nr:acyl-CoA dehydrogenase [Profundirhabdus halotolerans]